MKENKKAFIFILLLLIISLLIIIFFPKQNAGTAQISIDGNVVTSIELKNASDEIIDLSTFGKNIKIEIKEHKIRFLSSDCHNHICVNTGFIGNVGQTAVCLPNKTAITIIKS